MAVLVVGIILALLCPRGIGSSALSNLPEFQDTSGRELESPVQALVPSYTFSCYGRVIMWGACVNPGGNSNMYNISFQVYRPAAFGANRCYDLIGQNFLKLGIPGEGGPEGCVVLENIPPGNQIQVEPGDVVGFYSIHYDVDDSLKLDEGGVQLDSDRDGFIVWYSNTRQLSIGGRGVVPSHICVGTGNHLDMTTDRPPIITVQVVPSTSVSDSVYLLSSPTPTGNSQSQLYVSSKTSSHLYVSTATMTLSTSTSSMLTSSLTMPTSGNNHISITMVAGIGSAMAFGALLGVISTAVVVGVVLKRRRMKCSHAIVEQVVNPAYGLSDADSVDTIRSNIAYGVLELSTSDDPQGSFDPDSGSRQTSSVDGLYDYIGWNGLSAIPYEQPTQHQSSDHPNDDESVTSPLSYDYVDLLSESPTHPGLTGRPSSST